MKKSSKQKARSLQAAKLAKLIKGPSKSIILKVEKAFQKMTVTKAAGKKSKSVDIGKELKNRILLATKKANPAIKVTSKLKAGRRLLNKSQEKELKKLHKSRSLTPKALCKKFNVSTATLYNYINR